MICEAVMVLLGPVGFDLDMTLIDSRPQVLDSFRSVADETGVLIDLAVVESRLGLKLEDELAAWFEPSQIAEAAVIYRRHYVGVAASGTVALPGALDALDAVRASGRATAIITAKHESSVGPCLAATSMTADTIHSFVHGPEKTTVLQLIHAAMYVGDTPADMSAALAAGVVAIGVTTGAFGKEELLSAGASVVIPTLMEFPEIYTAMT
jgi:phosphoglycolate phosphatase